MPPMHMSSKDEGASQTQTQTQTRYSGWLVKAQSVCLPRRGALRMHVCR
jgi:hypothetical protein